MITVNIPLEEITSTILFEEYDTFLLSIDNSIIEIDYNSFRTLVNMEDKPNDDNLLLYLNILQECFEIDIQDAIDKLSNSKIIEVEHDKVLEMILLYYGIPIELKYLTDEYKVCDSWSDLSTKADTYYEYDGDFYIITKK